MEPGEFECPWPAGAVDLCFVMESEKDKELSITPLVTLIFWPWLFCDIVFVFDKVVDFIWKPFSWVDIFYWMQMVQNKLSYLKKNQWIQILILSIYVVVFGFLST